MSKETKKTMVPKLRFAEFREAGEWKMKKLGELANVVASGDLDSDLFSPTESNAHPYSVYSNAIEKEGLYGYYSSFKYPENSITITARGNLGYAFLRKRKFMGIGRLIVVNEFKHVDPNFLKESWNFFAIIPQEVTSIPQLTAITAKALLLPISLIIEEQQKIAAILTSLDDLIIAQVEKIKALQVHKKGLMQKLFPAKGEAVPMLRFGEFRGRWMENKLHSCIHLISGLHLLPNEYENTGEIPYLTGPSDFTNSKLDIKKWTMKLSNTANANDTLITVKGSGVGQLWYLTIPKAAIGRQLMAVRANGCNSQFLYYFLMTKRSRFEAFASGNLIPGLSRSDILDINILIPSLPEQQKIAACLSSLDDLITAQSQKLEALKMQKKGLMQQLFPNPNE